MLNANSTENTQLPRDNYAIIFYTETYEFFLTGGNRESSICFGSGVEEKWCKIMDLLLGGK